MLCVTPRRNRDARLEVGRLTCWDIRGECPRLRGSCRSDARARWDFGGSGSETIKGSELFIGRHGRVVLSVRTPVPCAFSGQLNGRHRSVGVGDPDGDRYRLRLDNHRRRDHHRPNERRRNDHDPWRGRPDTRVWTSPGAGNHRTMEGPMMSMPVGIATDPDAEAAMWRNHHARARSCLCGGRGDQQRHQHRRNRCHRDESLSCHRRTLSLIDVLASTCLRPAAGPW